MKLNFVVPIPRPMTETLSFSANYAVRSRGTHKVYALFETPQGAYCHLKHHPQGCGWAEVVNLETGEIL